MQIPDQIAAFQRQDVLLQESPRLLESEFALEPQLDSGSHMKYKYYLLPPPLPMSSIVGLAFWSHHGVSAGEKQKRTLCTIGVHAYLCSCVL